MATTNAEIWQKIKQLKKWHEENKPGAGNEDEFREKVIDILEDIVYNKI
jgi:hypothetical protein